MSARVPIVEERLCTIGHGLALLRALSRDREYVREDTIAAVCELGWTMGAELEAIKAALPGEAMSCPAPEPEDEKGGE